MVKKMRKSLVGFLTLLILLGVSGLTGCGEKKVDKTPISTDAASFIDQYSKDTEAKKVDYIGKYVQWDGKVSEVLPYNEPDKKEPDKDNNSIILTVAYLNGDETKPVKVKANGKFDKSIVNLPKGNDVKILGKIKSKPNDALSEWELEESEIVK